MDDLSLLEALQSRVNTLQDMLLATQEHICRLEERYIDLGEAVLLVVQQFHDQDDFLTGEILKSRKDSLVLDKRTPGRRLEEVEGLVHGLIAYLNERYAMQLEKRVEGNIQDKTDYTGLTL